MRMFNFEDAIADQLWVSSDKIVRIVVTDGDTLIVYLEPLDTDSGDWVDHVTITATNASEVVAERLANYMYATNIGGASVLKVKAATAPFADIDTSGIAYTAGITTA